MGSIELLLYEYKCDIRNNNDGSERQTREKIIKLFKDLEGGKQQDQLTDIVDEDQEALY